MITIEFSTENAAFGDSDHDTFLEAAHILHAAAESLMHQAQMQNGSNCTLLKLIDPIRDTNGNTVGTLTYTQDLFSEYTVK